MGKGSKPVIGYRYILGLHMGLCVGPIDALRQIVAGGKAAWSGTQAASGAITIHKPELFGGDKKEGGIDGVASVLMGEQTQTPNAYLVAQLGTPMPAFRGLCCVLFHGVVGAMNPYIKAWSFQVSKWIVGWRTDVWQPDLCQIDDGANAAHILYRAVTDPVTGLGRDPSALDLDRMLVAAQTLAGEGLGLCIKWSRSDVMGNFVAMICDHVAGIWADDPTTGLEYLRLFRADYDIDHVAGLDETNIIDLVSFEQASLAGSVNEVTVTYHDSTTNKDANVTVQNLANVQAQGRVINQSTSYPGIWNGDLATRIALRDLQAVSSLPARGKAKIKSSVTVRKGDVLTLSWARLKIAALPIRVLEIDRGTVTDGAVTITFAQDVYDVPSDTYVVVQPGLWTPPPTTPVPITDEMLVEATYRDAAARLPTAELAALGDTSGFVAAVAAAPPCVTYSYTMETRVGSSGDYIEVGSGQFAPNAALAAAMPVEIGPTDITLSDGYDLASAYVGSEVMIDDELLRVDAIDATTNTATLARGCVDTLPQMHALGARVWFVDNFTAVDPTEYLSGEDIEAKLLTRTPDGTLDDSLAAALSVTLDQRLTRPYPPAALTCNGTQWGAVSSISGTLTLAWVHRDRIIQADTLVDAAQSGIGPETGVAYKLICYDASDTVLVEKDDIAGNTADVVLNYTGAARCVLAAIRDGVQSLQQYDVTLAYTPPGGTVASSITASTYEPDTYALDGGGA